MWSAWLLALALFCSTVTGDVDSHRYAEGESVDLWANKASRAGWKASFHSGYNALALRRSFPPRQSCLTIFFLSSQVGPFPNPQETYPYYSLPFCKGDGPLHHYHSEGLGETVLGYNLVR